MMDKHFFPSRGSDAFPGGCPCCGEGLDAYSAETPDTYEYWRFQCGCELVADEKIGFTISDDCPDAMQQHVEGFILHERAA